MMLHCFEYDDLIYNTCMYNYMFPVENNLNSTYLSFTGTYKRICLHYRLIYSARQKIGNATFNTWTTQEKSYTLSSKNNYSEFPAVL